MPVIYKIEKENSIKVIVWETKESANFLIKNLILNNNEIKKYKSLKPKRQKNFLGICYSLKNLNLPINIKYDIKGKPFLDNPFSSTHISISHAYERVAVAIGNKPIGVDIEKFNPKKIIYIKNKFIRSDEASFIDKKNEIDQLHIIWGIKESSYKLYGGSLLNFLYHYKVEPFSINDIRIKCSIINNLNSEYFWAYYKKINDYYLIYVTSH